MSQTAIITGGARGIGFGIAKSLVESCQNIVLLDINAETLEKASQELEKEHGVKCLGIPCDITSSEELDKALAQSEDAFGTPDVLVNNAGICLFQEIMEMDESAFRQTLDVNLTGAFLLTQRVAKRMIAENIKGRIVFITSLAENLTSSRQGDYAASKAGLRMLMKSFAHALAPHGIRSNAVAPGLMFTDMTPYFGTPAGIEDAKTRIPLGRAGIPEDIGRVVKFLVSEDSGYVSGTTITTDGGFTIT